MLNNMRKTRHIRFVLMLGACLIGCQGEPVENGNNPPAEMPAKTPRKTTVFDAAAREKMRGLAAKNEKEIIAKFKKPKGSLLERIIHKVPQATHGSVFAFAPQGTDLAIGHRDGSISIWNLRDAKFASRFTAHEREIVSVCFSPDGKTILSCGADERIRWWNLASKAMKMEVGLWSRYARISPDRRFVATSDRLIRFDTGDLVYEFEVGSMGSKWSSDGKLLLRHRSFAKVDPNRNAVEIWHIPEMKRIRSILCGPYSFGFSISPDGRTVAIHDRKVRLVDLVAGDDNELERPSVKDMSYSRCVFSANGKYLIVCDERGIDFWDVRTSRELKPANLVWGKNISLSPGGQLLVTDSDLASNEICVWAMPQAITE